MVWLWVAIAAVLVIGPVAYLMPTKRDRRLSALRMQVHREGGAVDLENLVKLDAEAHERVTAGGERRIPTVSCVRYSLPAGKQLREAPEIQLLRQPNGGWAPDDQAPRNLPGEWWRLLEEATGKLPQDTLAVAIGPKGASMCWREAPPADEGSVTAVFSVLRDIRRRAVELLEPPDDDATG